MARLFARRRASSVQGGSDGAGLASSWARPVTERSGVAHAMSLAPSIIAPVLADFLST